MEILLFAFFSFLFLLSTFPFFFLSSSPLSGTRNSLTFVNTTAIAYIQKVSRSLKTLVYAIAVVFTNVRELRVQTFLPMHSHVVYVAISAFYCKKSWRVRASIMEVPACHPICCSPMRFVVCFSFFFPSLSFFLSFLSPFFILLSSGSGRIKIPSSTIYMCVVLYRNALLTKSHGGHNIVLE